MAENIITGTIGPTPVRNPNLNAMAKLLLKARGFANKMAIPEGFPLVGGQGVGDLLMGQAPEEFERWGYGDYPMVIPPTSNIPQFKTDRARDAFDAFSMLLAGAGNGIGAPGNAMLTAAGNPRLILARGMEEYGVQAALKTARQDFGNRYVNSKGMWSPSFAIKKDGLPDEFGDVFVLPHPRAVDPALNPDSVLYNADTFTGHAERGVSDTRLRFENPIDTDDYLLRASVSPRYNSLAHYENSATGAGSLGTLNKETGATIGSTNAESFQRVIKQLDKTIPNWREKLDIGAIDDVQMFDPFIMDQLRRRAPKAFAKIAPEIYNMRRAAGVGQAHAELKVLGDLPFTNTNIQHVLYPGPGSLNVGGGSRNQSLTEMVDALQKRGIPSTPYNDVEAAAEIARELQKLAKFR